MGNIERSADDAYREIQRLGRRVDELIEAENKAWCESERWKDRAVEAEQRERGAVAAERERIVARLVEMADALDPDAIAGTAETLRRAAAVLDHEGGR